MIYFNNTECLELSALQGISYLCIPFLGIARPQSQFPHSCVCERFTVYIPKINPHISLQQNGQKYINLSQIYEWRNWETEHDNSVLEITISFLGIHKWEREIYIEFLQALPLQCVAAGKNKIKISIGFCCTFLCVKFSTTSIFLKILFTFCINLTA